jgi:hypothetical protein
MVGLGSEGRRRVEPGHWYVSPGSGKSPVHQMAVMRTRLEDSGPFWKYHRRITVPLLGIMTGPALTVSSTGIGAFGASLRQNCIIRFISRYESRRLPRQWHDSESQKDFNSGGTLSKTLSENHSP